MLERLLKNKIDVDRVIGSIVKMFLENPYDNSLDNFNEVYKSPSGAVYYSKRGALSYFFTDEELIFKDQSYEEYVINKLYYFLTGNSSGIKDIDIATIEGNLRGALEWYIELSAENLFKEEAKKEAYRLQSNNVLDGFIDVLDYFFNENNLKIGKVGEYFVLISLLEKKRFDQNFDFLMLPRYFYEEYKSFIDKNPSLRLPLFLYAATVRYPSLPSDHPDVMGVPSFIRDSIMSKYHILDIIKHFSKLFKNYKSSIIENDSIYNIIEEFERIYKDKRLKRIDEDIYSNYSLTISEFITCFDSKKDRKDELANKKFLFLMQLLETSVVGSLNDEKQNPIDTLKAAYVLKLKFEKQAELISNYNKDIEKEIDKDIDFKRKDLTRFLLYSSDFFQYLYKNIRTIVTDDYLTSLKESYDGFDPQLFEDDISRFEVLMWDAKMHDDIKILKPWFWLPFVIHEEVKDDSNKPFKEKLFQKTQRLKRRLRDEER